MITINVDQGIESNVMKSVLEAALRPYFSHLGKVQAVSGSVYLDWEYEKYGFKQDTILKIYRKPHEGANTFNFDNVSTKNFWETVGISMEQIFVNFGTDLKELKIRTPLVFTVNKWKKDFAEKFKLHCDELGNTLYGNNIIVSDNNDVNHVRWHESSLQHDVFKFTGEGSIHLVNKNQCEDFEEIFEKFLKFKTFEELSGRTSNDMGECEKFEEIANTLNIESLGENAKSKKYKISYKEFEKILNVIDKKF